MRLRPALTRLLATLLLLQWGTAFGHCLRMAAPAAGFAVEICTSDGLHRVVLPAEDEGGDHHKAAAAICPACAGPAAVALPAPHVVIASPVLPVATPARWHPPATAPPATPRELPPSRAPPLA